MTEPRVYIDDKIALDEEKAEMLRELVRERCKRQPEAIRHYTQDYARQLAEGKYCI